MRESADQTPRHSPGSGQESRTPPYPPMPVRTVTVIKIGTALWALALVLTVTVPSLNAGERSWWPWTCVAGLALGLFGYLYVRRGRGNAEGVE